MPSAVASFRIDRASIPSWSKSAVAAVTMSVRVRVVRPLALNASEVRPRLSTEPGANGGPERIVVGSIYGGVVFEMKGDDVVGIFVGASAE